MSAERLRQSLIKVGFEGDFILFTENNLIAPKHKDQHYAFKPHAINELKSKYDIVIWADSILVAEKPLNDFISHIEKNGYAFFDNIGFNIGQYTSDKCLQNLEMEREDSFNHSMIMACLMGFNFKNEKACKLFEQYYNALNLKGCYEGDWSNEGLQVSEDMRVKGHRHDQSVMSIILAKEGIKPLHPHSTFFAYYGNPGHEPVSESVCFLSKEL
jgi:hypothetical protein